AEQARQAERRQEGRGEEGRGQGRRREIARPSADAVPPACAARLVREARAPSAVQKIPCMARSVAILLPALEARRRLGKQRWVVHSAIVVHQRRAITGRREWPVWHPMQRVTAPAE